MLASSFDRAFAVSISLLVVLAASAWGQTPEKVKPRDLQKPPQWGFRGEQVATPLTRDTRLSSYPGEEELNYGKSSTLKFKSYQEFSLIDFDPAPFRQKIVTGAYLRLLPNGKETLTRATFSTFHSDWTEGTGGGDRPQPGASSFRWKSHPNVPWGGDGDLTAVTLGQGGSIWASSTVEAPDASGFIRLGIDPAILAARIAGLSEGILVFDDVGSEWEKDGNKWQSFPFPNRTFFSLDSNKRSVPQLVIFVDGEDRDPPSSPQVVVDSRVLHGMPVLSWPRPAKEEKGAPLAGYRIQIGDRVVRLSAEGTTFGGMSRTTPSPKIYAAIPPEVVPAGAKSFNASVTAIDGAGNASSPVVVEIHLPKRVASPALALAELPKQRPAAEAPRLGSAEVSVVDVLDKMHPVHGAFEPKQSPGYWTLNHVWEASKKQIRLQAARNEFVHFQVLLRVEEGRSLADGKIEFQWNDEKGKLDPAARNNPPIEFFRLRHVETAKIGAMPDPLVPLPAGPSGKFSIPSSDEKIAGQRVVAIVGEVYVPHDAPTGFRRGLVRLTSGQERLDLNIELEVWNFTLPDYLSFLCEMNCYSLPKNERDYYRLAHRHRSFINRVPYSQRGEIDEGCAPALSGTQLDFAEWDKRFGPLLDGRAFNDLPRKGVPVDGFYLPLNENWPSKINDHYNGGYWADEAFTPEYRQRFADVSGQFTKHLAAQKWNDTLFHVFFNGKVDYKSNGWHRGSSPWLLDEPAHWQDFWALKYFGEAWRDGHEAAEQSLKLKAKERPAQILYRCDISRPQWQRDSLDSSMGYNVCAGGPFLQYRKMVLDRAKRFGQVVVIYGTANHPDASNVQGAAWCVDAWRLGADGVLPWQTIGTDQAWQKAEETCLFYPGEPAGLKSPAASVRLKSYLRGQQDVEYLTLWQQQTEGLVRDDLGQQIAGLLNLKGQREGTGFTGAEDAGRIAYTGLTPQALWQLRNAVGQKLHAAAPEAKRKLVTWPKGPAVSVSQ